MPAKDYELIEHTADIGIRVKAQDLRELFKNAALAMFDIIAEEVSSRDTRPKKIRVTQKADSLEELFINWLNELLSLSATKELIFSDFQINRLDKNSISSEALAKDIKGYSIKSEIKAATYHQLKLEQAGSGWQAEVIFDV